MEITSILFVVVLVSSYGQNKGIKTMLPHVDEFRPVHNLSSIEGLVGALSAAPPPHHRSLIRSVA